MHNSQYWIWRSPTSVLNGAFWLVRTSTSYLDLHISEPCLLIGQIWTEGSDWSEPQPICILIFSEPCFLIGQSWMVHSDWSEHKDIPLEDFLGSLLWHHFFLLWHHPALFAVKFVPTLELKCLIVVYKRRGSPLPFVPHAAPRASTTTIIIYIRHHQDICSQLLVVTRNL